jgi:hypothetical protein
MLGFSYFDVMMVIIPQIVRAVNGAEPPADETGMQKM